MADINAAEVADSTGAEFYDSYESTMQHITMVQNNIDQALQELHTRGKLHDKSKLSGIEKECLDKMGPQRRVSPDSEEYVERLKALKEMTDHHYKNNSHHPEFYPDGMLGMSLFDLIEMLCDWKAAAEARDLKPFNIRDSIKYGRTRELWNLTPELEKILISTCEDLGW